MGFGRIDLIDLGRITPSHFEGHLVFALDVNWINRFGKIPSFKAQINENGELCITSEFPIKKGENKIG